MSKKPSKAASKAPQTDAKTCPIMGVPCIKSKCEWHLGLRGVNPQTGAQIDNDGCSVPWIAMLMIENTQEQRSTGAAIESFRNEVVKQNERTATINAVKNLMLSNGAK